jgi:hypothetical protein
MSVHGSDSSGKSLPPPRDNDARKWDTTSANLRMPAIVTGHEIVIIINRIQRNSGKRNRVEKFVRS